jgi:hypothetical protein
VRSYVGDTAVTAGSAAESAALRKMTKYSDITLTNIFTPLAFETLGPINIVGLQLLQEIGQRMSTMTGDPRETSFLFQ